MTRLALRSVLVIIALTVMLQARVESTRWWWSSDVIRALELSPAQRRELDRVYDSTLPTRRHLAEQIVELADRVQRLNANDAADEEVMPATERLAHAQAARCELGPALIVRADGVLSPGQRAKFHRLLSAHRINAN